MLGLKDLKLTLPANDPVWNFREAKVDSYWLDGKQTTMCGP